VNAGVFAGVFFSMINSNSAIFGAGIDAGSWTEMDVVLLLQWLILLVKW
jgi:hypothetical protein